MRSYIYENEEDGSHTTFRYSGDFSGEVIITRTINSGTWTVAEVKVPCEALLELMGRVAQNRTVAYLESLSGLQFMERVTELFGLSA